MKCSICGHTVDLHRHPITKKVYWSEGHNAEPVNNGRCCTRCNNGVVIPRRIVDMAGCKEREEDVEAMRADNDS